MSKDRRAEPNSATARLCEWRALNGCSFLIRHAAYTISMPARSETVRISSPVRVCSLAVRRTLVP